MLRPHEAGVTLAVRAQPGAKKTAITGPVSYTHLAIVIRPRICK